LRRKAALHRLLAIGGASVALVARVSAAQGTEGLPAVAVEGVCPDRRSVQTILQSLLPAAGIAPAAIDASVSDRGAEYVVAARGRSKTYPDPDRNCAQRARIAAAFVALVLEPDSPPTGTERAAPPVPLVAAASENTLRASARPSEPPWARLDGLGAFELSGPSGLGALGLALELGAGRGAWGAWAACSWINGATMPLAVPGESVRIERFPCAIGLAARLVRPILEADLKVGAALGAMRASGQGFATTYSSERLEVGVRLALDAALHVSPRAHLLPLVGLEVTYYPVPYQLVGTPRGIVASTPTVWAGVTAGLRWNAL
jgi:hypothetical protein